MTLTTVPAERFWKTVSPAAVHRGVATLAAPRVADVTASDAAGAEDRPGCPEEEEPQESPHHLVDPRTRARHRRPDGRRCREGPAIR